MAQILGHLIGNAIRYTSQNGSVNLRVKRVNEDEKSVSILFSVSDMGSGMTPKQLSDILDRFQEIDSNKYSDFSKVGWGLIISYISIRLLGGELKIETKENIGSTFSFELKLIDQKNFGQK